jgi:hypothetical protein
MYPTFNHWAYVDHLLPMLTMYSPCTHWVFGPLPPVWVGPYRMPTPSSSGSTGSVDAGPQPMSKDGGSPITFTHGWGTKDQENVPPVRLGSAVGGLILIQEDGGEIDQGMERIMEDNHVKLLLQAAATLNEDEFD